MPISRRDAFPTTKPSPMCQYPSGPTRCRKAAFVEKGPVRRCSSMGSPTALSSAARPTLIAHVTTICVAGCARNFVSPPQWDNPLCNFGAHASEFAVGGTVACVRTVF